MKTAILYAGQGAQRPGMGLDLYEGYPEFSKAIDEAAAVTDFDLKSAMFGSDAALLARTEITQPALAAFAAGVTAVLSRYGIQPDYVAGLSLGEYSALQAAGVFTLDQLIRLTSFRGRAMAEAGRGIDTLMCAVLGLSSEQTEAICKKAQEETGQMVQVVNYNTVGQEVISGTKEGVRRAEELAKDMGCKRCMELKVSSAFHTSFMEGAGQALHKKFRTMNFGKMQVPVVFNCTGRELEGEETIADLLVRQVQSPVKMRQTIEDLADHGVDIFIEVGPGHALSGFVKRAVKGAAACFIDSAADLKDVLDKYGKKEA